MPEPFDPTLLVGVPLIDDEHQQIFHLIGNLLEAMHQGASAKRLGPLLDELEGYVARHFRDEERIMALHQFPGLGAQREAHRGFTERIAALRSRYEASGPTCDISVAVNRLLGSWMREHIAVADAALGRFLQAEERRPPESRAAGATATT